MHTPHTCERDMATCTICLEPDGTTAVRHMLPCKCAFPLCDACLTSVTCCLYCRTARPGGQLSEATLSFFVRQRQHVEVAKKRIEELQQEILAHKQAIILSFGLGFLFHTLIMILMKKFLV